MPPKAAAAAAGGKPAREVNLIHQDEIWRQHVRFENDLQKSFPSNWGFLTGSLHDQFAVKDEGDGEDSPAQRSRDADPARMTQVRSSLLRTTSRSYGGGRTLEIFGVAQHAVKTAKFD